MFGYRGDGQSSEQEIYLNVYDLNPQANGPLFNIGLGFYHTGIQFGSTEYTFAGHDGSETGVMEVSPKVNHPNFRETILLGKTTMPLYEIHKVIDNLRDKFPGNSYNTIRKNCNTFTNCVCQAVLHKPIPAWINRMANIGKIFVQIDDFIRIRPYNQKYEVNAQALGVVTKKKQNPFDNGSGVMIG